MASTGFTHAGSETRQRYRAKWALEESVNAHEEHPVGLVQRVWPDDSANPGTHGIAADWQEMPAGVGQAKYDRIVHSALRTSLIPDVPIENQCALGSIPGEPVGVIVLGAAREPGRVPDSRGFRRRQAQQGALSYDQTNRSPRASARPRRAPGPSRMASRPDYPSRPDLGIRRFCRQSVSLRGHCRALAHASARTAASSASFLGRGA